jgi:hypothetical protein
LFVRLLPKNNMISKPTSNGRRIDREKESDARSMIPYSRMGIYFLTLEIVSVTEFS